jgi:hypothetical protein
MNPRAGLDSPQNLSLYLGRSRDRPTSIGVIANLMAKICLSRLGMAAVTFKAVNDQKKLIG